MDDPTRSLIIFASIHHALAAESLFKHHGLWCDVVPIPKDISPDCGMAVEFRRPDQQAVQNLLIASSMGNYRIIQYPRS